MEEALEVMDIRSQNVLVVLNDSRDGNLSYPEASCKIIKDVDVIRLAFSYN